MTQSTYTQYPQPNTLKKGGNSFGEELRCGTKDNENFVLIQNNQPRLIIDQSGNTAIGASVFTEDATALIPHIICNNIMQVINPSTGLLCFEANTNNAYFFGTTLEIGENVMSLIGDLNMQDGCINFANETTAPTSLTPVKWVEVKQAGSTYKMPLYQ